MRGGTRTGACTGDRTRACGRVGSLVRRGQVSWGQRLHCASIRRACAGSPGPRSPRSADGPVIIISRPVLPDHFLAPWTAVSLASLRRRLKSHFSSLLYFAHSINLECDPARGSVHLCLASGTTSPEDFFFLSLSFSPPLLFHPRSQAIREQREREKTHLGCFTSIPQLKVSCDALLLYQPVETPWQCPLIYRCNTLSKKQKNKKPVVCRLVFPK